MSGPIDPYKAPPIKNQRIKLSTNAPFTPSYVKSQLVQTLNAAEVYATRVRGRVIALANPARESKAWKERVEARARGRAHRAKANAGIVGRREGVNKGMWRMDEGSLRFAMFLPLHHLWLGYMSELLGLTAPAAEGVMGGAAGMQAKLVKADFHGSFITVNESKNPCLVGLSGLVLEETENAFRVITPKDAVKLIPKQGSIFQIAVPGVEWGSVVSGTSTIAEMPHCEVLVYGNQIRFRAGERAGRKVKSKGTVELV